MSQDNSEEEMLRSICEELGIPNLIEVLENVPLRRLRPILVHAWKKRVAKKRPEDLLAEYESKLEFYGVGSIAQSELNLFAQTCQASVPQDFDVVQTSPITPMGLNSVLSRVSQNNCLPTIRGSEVVSDVTTQLALECAHRRKKVIRVGGVSELVHLCSSGRVLRLQPFDKQRGYMQHFNLFALCSGGINSANEGGFAVPLMQRHIGVLLDILKNLQSKGYQFADLSVNISDMRFLEQLIAAQKLPAEEIRRNSMNDDFDVFREYRIDFPREATSALSLGSHFKSCGLKDRTGYFSRLEENIISPLRLKYPGVRFCFDFTRKSGLGYYPHLCFHIFCGDRSGGMMQLADGGAVDWLAKLLGNRREAMVTSGIGSELIQKLFSPKTKPC